MKYQIGDTVLYPMHGAGIIEAIEEREILGETKKYYIMKMPAAIDMKVMLPIENLAEIGVRDLISISEAKKVMKSFSIEPEKEDTNWNKRYRDNTAKIKTGDIYEVLDVVKNLLIRDKQKGLSSGERKMYSNAKHILFSELILCGASDAEKLDELLNEGVEKIIEKR